ncbi:MAG: hypothetical protein BGO78_15515 [Chloroflexi bacterium 44-23]|nr:MAG: hypothetical protein BGO78_15515 [Chloroflexi bacterium 44-23]
MTEQIHLTIDQQPVTTGAGTTILKAAQENGIEIPTICFHDSCTANALCRICVVEVTGARTLIPSCVAKVSEGMVVETQSERVRLSRKTILEMMASTTDLSQSPEIIAMFAEYDVEEDRFPDATPRHPEIIDDNSMFIRDYAKCILCWRCVQVCATDAQYAFAINFKERGYNTQISTFFEIPLPETTCVFCGQCIGVCPTNALKPKKEWLLEQGMEPETIMSLTRQERRKRGR